MAGPQEVRRDGGCGDGALARRLADAGAQRVLAVDGSEWMLALAARQPHPRVCYQRGDIETLRQLLVAAGKPAGAGAFRTG